MAETTKCSPPKPAKKSSHQQRQRTSRSKHKRRTESQLPPAPPPPPPLHSWTAVRRFSCSGSLCRDTRVIHGAEASLPETSRKWVLVSGCNDSAKRSMKVPLKPKEANRPPQASSSSSSSTAVAGSGSLKGRNLRRFSGCYECRMVVDPIHGAAKSYALRNSIFPCPHCGHIFAKSDALELHQTVRHAGN